MSLAGRHLDADASPEEIIRLGAERKNEMGQRK